MDGSLVFREKLTPRMEDVVRVPGRSAQGDTRKVQNSGRPTVLRVRPSGDGTWGVVTVEGTGHAHQTEPCRRCPWRTDAPIGAFPAQVFRDSAHTSYDQSQHAFGCHSDPEDPKMCAGFLMRGAAHNITVRVAIIEGKLDPTTITSPVELYPDYRAMAIANGVAPDDPVLEPCRTNPVLDPIDDTED